MFNLERVNNSLEVFLKKGTNKDCISKIGTTLAKTTYITEADNDQQDQNSKKPYYSGTEDQQKIINLKRATSSHGNMHQGLGYTPRLESGKSGN